MKQYFTEDEFKCKCGCGLDTRQSTKDRFNKSREYSGVPYVITSGARCLKHNRYIGSKDTSAHVDLCAGDIKFKNSNEKFLIVRGLIKAGFNRIGINEKKKFIHADDSETLPPNVMFKY